MLATCYVLLTTVVIKVQHVREYANTESIINAYPWRSKMPKVPL